MVLLNCNSEIKINRKSKTVFMRLFYFTIYYRLYKLYKHGLFSCVRWVNTCKSTRIYTFFSLSCIVFQVFYCLIGGQTGPQMCWAKPPDLYRHTFHIKSLGKQPARASNDKNGQPAIKNQTWAHPMLGNRPFWSLTYFTWACVPTQDIYVSAGSQIIFMMLPCVASFKRKISMPLKKQTATNIEL
jgi:hypothetical protein